MGSQNSITPALQHSIARQFPAAVPQTPLASPIKSAAISDTSPALIGRYLPVASAKDAPDRLRSVALASKILFLRLAESSPEAMTSAPGWTRLMKRIFSSAQKANLRVLTMQ